MTTDYQILNQVVVTTDLSNAFFSILFRKEDEKSSHSHGIGKFYIIVYVSAILTLMHFALILILCVKDIMLMKQVSKRWSAHWRPW